MGQRRGAFGRAPDGHVRIAFAPPSEAATAAGEAGVDAAGALQYGAGALYRESGTRAGELTLAFESADAATAVATDLETGLERFQEEMAGQAVPGFGDQLATFLEETTVSQDGSELLVENTDGDGWLLLVPLAVVGSFVIGLGDQQSAGRRSAVAPQVAFDVDWDEDREMATITHASSAVVRADRLFVQTGSRRRSWPALGGESSATLGDTPGIAAGDSVTFEVAAGQTIRIVWEASSGDPAAVLQRVPLPEP